MEKKRIAEMHSGEVDWELWGPYVSERQWGTVREDYSEHGNAWSYLTHDAARSTAYRWGEDGIAGICDKTGSLNFALTLWNHKDDILKERLFGLSGPEGNHGEDVKEVYFQKENVPTHSYMRYVYFYPTVKFPYQALVKRNAKRSKGKPEFEITGLPFWKNRSYVECTVQYAKNSFDDLSIKLSFKNHCRRQVRLSVMPTLWFHNVWSFNAAPDRRLIKKVSKKQVTAHFSDGTEYIMNFPEPEHLLFTENETNLARVGKGSNNHDFKKDLFHEEIVSGNIKKSTERGFGSKCSPLYHLQLKSGEETSIQLRLFRVSNENDCVEETDVFSRRRAETENFYQSFNIENSRLAAVHRSALSGLLWSKQLYRYNVQAWLFEDIGAKASHTRHQGRNSNWKTLVNNDVHLMPDKWEYPWYAAWDTAFHCVSMAQVDLEFAKKQLYLYLQEGYMNPQGQIPAYEWSFSDVNPPVQAWAAMEIYEREINDTGRGDTEFLLKMFNRLNLNFTWWVNREDKEGQNLFQGGFLGLDNIGVFDRSEGVPAGGYLQQVDGTAWMALYALHMLEISLELALENRAFEEMAIKYFTHFVHIAEAFNAPGGQGETLWDSNESFYYDKLVLDDRSISIKVRSIAGLLPLTAINEIRAEFFEKLPNFEHTVNACLKREKSSGAFEVVQSMEGGNRLIALVPRKRSEKLFSSLLDEDEFLAPYGIRSLSKVHEEPYHLNINGSTYSIQYQPAESDTMMFGGNSNWRGPVWFPLNYLLLRALDKYSVCYSNVPNVENPLIAASGILVPELTKDLAERLVSIFLEGDDGVRPVNRHHKSLSELKELQDHVLFYEYYHPEIGRGFGASHQTGWTALVSNIISRYCIPT